MKQLWTPWRMKFIMDSKKPTDGCVFCHLQTLEDGPENLILYRDETSFVLINKYPYNTGHLLVIPKQHEADLAKLEPAVLSSLMENIQRSIEVLKKTYHPAGFNVGSNLGATAGAGIPEHLHFHIVPRWSGDTNFMPILGETKVLPETLEETYDRLKQHF